LLTAKGAFRVSFTMAQLPDAINPDRGSRIFSYPDSVISEIAKEKRVSFSITWDSYFWDYNKREVRMARQGTAARCHGGTKGAKAGKDAS